jgi:hypothetical protein
LGFFHDVELGVGAELVELAGPDEEGVLGGVVIGVFGEDVGWGWGGVGCGVAELELLVAGEA